MKKAFVLFTAVIGFSLFGAGEMSNLDWKVVNGKMANWSGNMVPSKEGVILKKGISYSRTKYLIGDKRKVQVTFTVKGIGSSIGLYYYTKPGLILGGTQERFPNADSFKTFEAVFELPETAKSKKIGSFRVYFTTPENLQIKEIKMKFVD
jgi:hypothetical protein